MFLMLLKVNHYYFQFISRLTYLSSTMGPVDGILDLASRGRYSVRTCI
ncbi:hypothetical protein Pan241w_58550 [Gimesia alba]|uniref:Uncharacterized protein n=1 Tax=Gimesia alba TaxID=2527973 RepID=A0A517RPC7_9PLAN|nr:hypothetical protein Pan241w_58550 [Gimesia alba]